MRLVKVSDLAIGHTVAADVSNSHQQVIMPAGTSIDTQRRRILKAWGIHHVPVEGSSEPEPCPAPPLENQGVKEHILALPSMATEVIAASPRTLPSLPSVYFQVDRVINHASSSASDIATVLGNDQALCVRLLRIANSAFYGFPHRIVGVSGAVRVVGARQLRDLVLATVVLMQLQGLDARLVNKTSSRRHGPAADIAARAIAAFRRESNTDRFFD